MITLKLFCVLLLQLGSSPTAIAWDHVSGKELASRIDGGDSVLVAFVLPDQKASDSLEPEWLSAASESKNALLSIDCSTSATTCDEHEVISYPSIRFLSPNPSSSQTKHYRGPRKAADITAFLSRASRPPLTTLTENTVLPFQKTDTTVLIAYLSPAADPALAATFTTLASTHHARHSFALAPGALPARAAGAPYPSIVCYNNQYTTTPAASTFTPQPQTLLADLAAFLETCSAPPIGALTRRSELAYMSSGRSLVYIFGAEDGGDAETGTLEDARVALAPVARRYSEYIDFVTVDVGEYAEVAAALGVQGAEDGRVRIALSSVGGGQVWRFGGGVSAKAVEWWIGEVAEGKVAPEERAGGGAGSGAGKGHDEL